MKSEIRCQMPLEDGETSCYIEFKNDQMDEEKFKKTLREEQGIYFNVNILPSSPNKRVSSIFKF